MKTITAVGFTLLIFSLSDSWWIKGFTIAYLLLSVLVELYVIGDEATRID